MAQNGGYFDALADENDSDAGSSNGSVPESVPDLTRPDSFQEMPQLVFEKPQTRKSITMIEPWSEEQDGKVAADNNSDIGEEEEGNDDVHEDGQGRMLSDALAAASNAMNIAGNAAQGLASDIASKLSVQNEGAEEAAPEEPEEEEAAPEEPEAEEVVPEEPEKEEEVEEPEQGFVEQVEEVAEEVADAVVEAGEAAVVAVKEVADEVGDAIAEKLDSIDDAEAEEAKVEEEALAALDEDVDAEAEEEVVEPESAAQDNENEVPVVVAVADGEEHGFVEKVEEVAEEVAGKVVEAGEAVVEAAKEAADKVEGAIADNLDTGVDSDAEEAEEEAKVGAEEQEEDVAEVPVVAGDEAEVNEEEHGFVEKAEEFAEEVAEAVVEAGEAVVVAAKEVADKVESTIADNLDTGVDSDAEESKEEAKETGAVAEDWSSAEESESDERKAASGSQAKANVRRMSIQNNDPQAAAKMAQLNDEPADTPALEEALEAAAGAVGVVMDQVREKAKEMGIVPTEAVVSSEEKKEVVGVEQDDDDDVAHKVALIEAARRKGRELSQKLLNAVTGPSDETIEALRGELTELIQSKECGPIMVRLSWHDAGTYCAHSSTGGPRSCMRHDVGEATHTANNGLGIARGLLGPIIGKYHGEMKMSVADIWSLAGVVAVEVMGGPKVQWRAGRKDAVTQEDHVEEGRLPDAAQGRDHLREVFYRMGLNDRDIVALSGAHTVGRCHVERSGFEGPWTKEPLKFDNSYFKLLVEEYWEPALSSSGLDQFQDSSGAGLMMLPSDVALLRDTAFKAIVEEYAEDQEKFFADFAVAFQKLQELGVYEFPNALDLPADAGAELEIPQKPEEQTEATGEGDNAMPSLMRTLTEVAMPTDDADENGAKGETEVAQTEGAQSGATPLKNEVPIPEGKGDAPIQEQRGCCGAQACTIM